jgi:uncharacterized damage-inducible protein DinB
MTDRELYVQRTKLEYPKFERVFAALPKERLDYRPHERSPSAAQIVWTLAREHAALCDIVDKGRTDWSDTPPRAYDEMVSMFNQSWKRLGDSVARLDDAGWTKKGQMLMGGKVAGEQPVGQFLWGFLFDAVHHRGQLTTYIRPMGGKVPSIYGPSADEAPR